MRPLEAGVAHRRHNALATFAHGAVGESDHGERGQLAIGVDLDVDEVGVDAVSGGGEGGGGHVESSVLSGWCRGGVCKIRARRDSVS